MLKKLLSISLLTASLGANATLVNWTDWDNTSDLSTVSGSMNIAGTLVDVTATHSAGFNFVQYGETAYNNVSGCNSTNSRYREDYWATENNGTAFNSGSADNSPIACELISINAGGTVTLSFSQSIQNLFIGFISVNSNVIEFDAQVAIDSNVDGRYGVATPFDINDPAPAGATGVTVSSDGKELLAADNAEFHGLLSAHGSFTSLTFTSSTENWHGFTLGAASLTTQDDDDQNSNPIPEPTSLGLLALVMIGARRLMNKA